MLISQLQARDFRLFGNLLLDAHPRFNLITGDNGAGKTSLLEALHVLGRGNSWRVLPAQLARDGTQAWQVAGQIVDPSGAPPDLLKLTWRDREIANRIRILKITLWASVIVAIVSLIYSYVTTYLTK